MKHLFFAIVLSLMTLNVFVDPVDLNTASAQEIAKSLNGIGLSKAKKSLNTEISLARLIHQKSFWQSKALAKKLWRKIDPR
jgi:competence protein ComEA